LRLFIRQILKMTFTRTSDRYVVHELLTAEDTITPCDLPSTNSTISEPNVMHSSEVAGLDIRPSPEDGLWRAVTYGKGTMSEIVVDVGPVLHRGMSFFYLYASMKHVVSFRSLCWLRIF
jgi:ribonuclease Z